MSGKALKRIVWMILGLLGIGAAVCIVVPALLLGVLLSLSSQRTIFERSPSPKGWQEARVQFDDAGAVSGFSRLVFVKPRWNVSDAPLLSCRAFWAEGREEVHLRWINKDTLLIRHAFPPDAVQAVASHCGSVRIVTEAIPSAIASSSP